MPWGLAHRASRQSPSSTHSEAPGRGGSRPLGHADGPECEDLCSLILVSKVGVLKVSPYLPLTSDHLKLSISLSSV